MGEVRSNWDLLRKEFLEKFYPPKKTDKLRREISCIVQRDGETLNAPLRQASPRCGEWRFIDQKQDRCRSMGSYFRLADSIQYSRVRSPQPKALNEVFPSGDAILTKTLGEMTILLR
ncbi:hypothetical protein AHAS_Ahas16G0190700 [Arachis hypogaea]